MDYYVSKKAGAVQDGTEQKPFSTIGQAAQKAAAGDTVWIGEGIYREWVCPENGGSDEEHRITYRNIPGERAVISGAELIQNWVSLGDDIWKAVIPGEVLSAYNPYSDEIYGDWYDNFGQVHHTGEIFVDDVALFEAPDLKNIKQEDKEERKCSWFAAVHENETEVWIYLPGKDPNEHVVEASVRPYCFFPEKEGLNYITVSGLVMEKVATQWAPPTAFQPGAVGTHWSKCWIIEDCVISNSKCCGISLGKRHDVRDNIWTINPEKDGSQTYTEIIMENLKRDWSRENVGSHIIRNNEIYDCGQTGIVGCMGAIYSEIYGNHIYRANIRNEFGGAEMAGIKLHGAIDVLIENNLIHDCIRGLWLDWEAQGARVSKNAMFGNVSEDIFIEVCHGPCTVENNLLLSECSLLSMSQGSAFVHNLFGGSVRMRREINRFTLYHFPHDTFVAGSMLIYGGDDKVYQNIYAGNHEGKAGVDLVKFYGADVKQSYGNAIYNGYRKEGEEVNTMTDNSLMPFGDGTFPVYIHKNLYFKGAEKYEAEADACEAKDFELNCRVVRDGDMYYFETNLPEYAFKEEVGLVTTETLGKSFQTDQAYENMDGTPFVLDKDFTGAVRGEKTIPGPFAKPAARILLGPVGSVRE